MYEYRIPARHMSRHNSFGTAPSSPGSMASARPSLHDYRTEHNGSVTSFRPLPSPGFGSNRYQPPRHASYSRNMTPISTVRQPQRFGSTASLDSGPASPTDSIVPFYYDYSESFHGADGLVRSPTEHPPIPEVTVDQEEDAGSHHPQSPQAQDPFHTMPGSNLSPAELPTKHNRRASEQSTRSRHSRKTSNKSDLSVRLSSQAIEEHPAHEHEQYADSDARETQSEPDSSMNAADKPEHDMGRNSTNSPRNWPSPSSSTFFTNACRSPRNLTDLAAKAHSPELREVGSIDAVAQDHRTPHDKQQESARSEDYRLPTPKFRPLSFGMIPESRPSTSPVSIVYGVPEIVSPRPERPTSSQSRKRFSKILDVGQNAAIVESYSSGYPMSAAFTKLERVEEASSPNRTPPTASPHTLSTGKTFRKAMTHSSRPASTHDRWSGVTSHDKSTVESLLERHIECLGLKPAESTASNTSIYRAETNHELELIPELEVPDIPSTIPSPKQESRPRTDESNRPTSLSSSAQRKLMPRRLFASFGDGKTPEFPLASSESDPRFSLAWTDEKAMPSYGWLPLPSESNLNIEAEKSTQTLLSGDYADVESGRAVERFKLRRHSSPSPTPISKVKTPPSTDQTALGERNRSPCRRSQSDAVAHKETQKHRKLKIHLKSHQQRIDSPVSDDWVSTDDRSGHSDMELHRLGLTRVPVSAVDGFAELSGESANASQQSLTSMSDMPNPKSPDTWSGIVAAMPLPARKPTGLRRKESANTIRSHDSKRTIVEPVNNSRVDSRRTSRDMRPKSSVPRLSTPAFGPAMRVSQFDLSAGYQMKSPRRKQSSFSEPMELSQPSPTQYGRHSMRTRRRFDSFRQLVPSSVRSFTFSPQRGGAHQHQHVTIAHACREERPVSYVEQSSFPETVAMSDLTYRKHKLLEKFKEWLRCGRRVLGPKRRRSGPSGGFLV
ncbi:hypothetical protein OHC33_002221 [Knufia fluminis]|uniref:Uncharacterized protein n=1 Tax=Knufia fluminis TaxID=191047 RepID=A0AAN8I807_9EURO|nr:hypothetical protein OHC33_002221 [Knufia fluminis]